MSLPNPTLEVSPLKKRSYPSKQDDEDSDYTSESDQDRDKEMTTNVAGDAETTNRGEGSSSKPPRQNRKKSKVWECFERGEYNRTAHRFTAFCKFCLKKFDGRLNKLKSHVMECSEIRPEEKLVYAKESESESSDDEMNPKGNNLNDSNLDGLHGEKSSRRGRPASKLWECFERGAYSKSAHRFAAVCKYCHSTIDGRKHKLKTHILTCSSIDMSTKELYRNVSIDENHNGPTPKKAKLGEVVTPKGGVGSARSKTSLTGSGGRKSSLPLDDSLMYDHGHPDISIVDGNETGLSSMYHLTTSNEPYDYLVRFFIAHSIPLSAFSSINLQHFINLLDPSYHLKTNKQEIIDLITRNYNLLKQQEANIVKSENFLTLIFHSEEEENTKTLTYYSNILLKNGFAYNLNTFHLKNKNEVHYFANRWKHSVLSNTKVAAVTCDTEENLKLANEWVNSSSDTLFRRIITLRSFNHLLVEFVSCILGHPWAAQVLTEALTLVTSIHSFHLNVKNNSTATPAPAQQAANKKYEQLLEELNVYLIPVLRNQFTSILLMVETILQSESLLMDLKNHLRNLPHSSSHLPHVLNHHQQTSSLFNLLNSSKFWTSIKLLYLLCKPFLDILYHLEFNKVADSASDHKDNFIPLVEVTAYWIYLTNQLEVALLQNSTGFPDDFKQHIINIYNLKLELNNILVHDIYKLVLFLSPKYIKGLQVNKESFFKSLLKFSCTFIQHYGYNEQECSKLISQMIYYRNQHLPDSPATSSSNPPSSGNNANTTTAITSSSTNDRAFSTFGTSSDYVELKDFWQNYSKNNPVITSPTANASGGFTILQTLASLLLNIVPSIKGQGSMSSIQLNGQLSKLSTYEDFFPELSDDTNNSQFLSMIESIRAHEFFAW
jgi:hypothetical protein